MQGNLMPFGAVDLDFGHQLSAYYSFRDDSIHDVDGSIAYFDATLTDVKPLELNENEIKAVSAIISKKFVLPILDSIAIRDGLVIATDLDHTIVLKNKLLPDGMYSLRNKALVNTGENVEDYPSISDIKQASLIGTINKAVLEFHLKKIEICVSKDDLRPQIMGFLIENEDGKIRLTATDAHVLYSNSIAQSKVTDEKFTQVICPNPAKLLKALVAFEDEEISIFTDGRNIFFAMSGGHICFTKMDNSRYRYLDYRTVIPMKNQFSTKFTISELKNCIKSFDKKEFEDRTVRFISSNEGFDVALLPMLKDKSKVEGINEKDVTQLCHFDETTTTGEYPTSSNLFILMPSLVNIGMFGFSIKGLKKLIAISDAADFHFEWDSPTRAFVVKNQEFSIAKESVKVVEKGKGVVPEGSPPNGKIEMSNITKSTAQKEAWEMTFEEFNKKATAYDFRSSYGENYQSLYIGYKDNEKFMYAKSEIIEERQKGLQRQNDQTIQRYEDMLEKHCLVHHHSIKQTYISIKQIKEKYHKRKVSQALSEGKPVPTEVLADYPDLQPQKINLERFNKPMRELLKRT